MDTGRAAAGDGSGGVERIERVHCSQCGHELVFSGPRPLFCGFCGKPLTKVDQETSVLPRVGPEAPTLAPFTPAPPEIGPEPQAIGGYRLLRRLGGGGMGTVYEAEDSAGRHVALKLILGGEPGSRDTLERFRREGRLASAIAHPRCVFVLAADEDAGRPYIVMELMPGETLADLLNRRGPLPPGEAVAKIVDVLDGLREAHRLGFVHRDIKPSNCFLDVDGRVKVGDFGLSRSLVSDTRVTQTGAFLGTPLFASPEQVRGEPPGPQSDVYSLAATLYCLLTGRAPFEGGDAASTLARIAADPAPPMRNLHPELPAALDRAVLRGLERDRQRRFRDLDEFREALLPFLPGQQDAARRGVRFAAYLVDAILLKVVAIVAQTTALIVGLFAFQPYIPAERLQAAYLAAFVLWAVYFVVQERLWGCTPGKRLLRLRVCSLPGGEPPGWGRAALRFLVFYSLLFAGSNVIAPWILQYDVETPEGQEQARQLSGAMFLLEIIGVVLLFSTMRRRNGWRGLHEFASGTRVVHLPEPVRRRRSASGSALVNAESRSEAHPERVGPFQVRGVLRWDDNGRVLLGEDPSLGRSVLLWLRPETEAPLSAARHACARATRLRWLSAGQQHGWRWDAFPAPAGQPLAGLVATAGRLRWPEARPVLEQLAEELEAAAADGTLPDPLTVGLVWIQTDGSALLLDVPLCREDGHTAADESGARGLDLLRQTALLALEGSRPVDPKHIRATVPEYATRLLDRLLDKKRPYRSVAEFRRELESTRARPAAVTPDRRAAHLVVQAALLFFGLCFMVGGTWLAGIIPLLALQKMHQSGLRALQEFEAAAAADLVAGTFAPLPFPRAAAVRQWEADLDLAERLRQVVDGEARELKAREEGVDWLTQAAARSSSEFARITEEGEAKQPQGVSVTKGAKKPRNDYRAEAEGRLSDPQDAASLELGVTYFALAAIGTWPVLWVVSAFVSRGGLSYPLMGLSLVRTDGRRAGRFRCAWRALLVWAPLVLVLSACVLLREWYWASPADRAGRVWVLWAVETLRWASLGLLAVYPVLAIRSPERTPADRLAGTCLVPR